MNLIQKLKIRKELKRLEARVHESPSPSAFIDLGQVYINLGMLEKTVALADEGLALFPQSAELRKLRKFAKKNQLSARITDLRAAMAKSPSPGVYSELADVYLELGDMDAVHGLTEECIRRFPQDTGAYLVQARASLTAFYRDLSARAGIVAVELIRKAIKIDGRDAKAHKLMADVCYRVGALATARRHIDELVRLGVGDDEIRNMQRACSDASGDEDLDALFHRAEFRGGLARGAGGTSGRTGDPLKAARDALTGIVQIPGVTKAVYIVGAKALVRGDVNGGDDPFLRLVRVMARAAHRAARRMDIGSFNKGVVDGNFGRICLCSFGDALAAVQCEGHSSVEAVLEQLQELVANSLVGSEGGDA
ncbi:MAG: hypothetical protein HZB39_13040 [Planctomycetes bacterium]|nr:hypothetical protein [Planctomycetota bacterium]